jgi:uncharacterized protein with HEPN domain
MTVRDNEIIKKLIQYCEKINGFIIGHDYNSFITDEKIIFACSFALGQIGELAGKLSDEFTQGNTLLPWRKMTALRHRIVHGYDSVEMHVLWEIVSEDIPHTKTVLDKII